MNMPSILDTQSAVPTHLQQYTEEAGAATGMITSMLSMPNISIKGKQFALVKDGVTTPFPIGQPLSVVILGYDPPINTAKSWYKNAYAPGSNEMPDCASADGIRPDAFIASPVSRSCAECPNNEFGSGTNAVGQPSKGKACSDYKHLFVVAADDLHGEIAAIRVPATSLKNLSGFAATVAKHKVPIQSMVTEMTFDEVEHPQLKFRPERWLDEAQTKAMVDRGASDELEMMKPTNQLGAPAAAPAADVQAIAPPASVPAPPPIVPAVPTAPPAARRMTAKAEGIAYDSYKAQGWSDAQLVEYALMEA